jgi:hypothetical protein
MTSIRTAVVLACIALVGASSTPKFSSPGIAHTASRIAAGKVQGIEGESALGAAVAQAAAATAPVVAAAAPVAAAAAPIVSAAVQAAVPMASTSQHYFDQLRAKLRWVDVRWRDKKLRTPDDRSRLLLVQSAAQRAGLHEVGLNYHDVYGVIEAETSWIPRVGLGKNGTPSFGLAQFEPATARAVGLSNPNDPVEAVHAAAMHLKEAALWSSRRIADLNLKPQEHAAKLREGISIYYNLSSKGRAKWNGLNTAKLPVETRRHIRNTELGAREAAELSAQLARIRQARQAPGTVTAGLLRSGG